MTSKVIILVVLHLSFSISHKCYFLGFNDQSVHEGGQIWDELEDNGIITLDKRDELGWFSNDKAHDKMTSQGCVHKDSNHASNFCYNQWHYHDLEDLCKNGEKAYFGP